MIEKFFSKNWQIILFNFLLLLVYVIFYGKFGDIIVDSFREAYVPCEILKGKVLYKDIFTIYAPFPYLFNSFVCLIFGTKLKVFYTLGLLATAGILNLAFNISKKFVPKTYALGIILLILSVSVLSPNVFNFIFPYSYGALYGVFFALASIYFAINKREFWAYLFYSFAICSKYEFVFLILALFWLFGIKNIGKMVIAVLIPIILNVIPLIIQGISMQDVIYTLAIIFTMGTSKTLVWFYSISGLFFCPQLIPIYLTEFAKLFIPLLLIFKFKRLILYVGLFVYLYFFLSPKSFIFAFPLILLLLITEYNKINRKKEFVVLASVLVSLKLFFAFTFQSYGVFFIPFVLISLFILIPKKFKSCLLIIIIFASICYAGQNIPSLMEKNVKIKTEQGYLYMSQKYARAIKEMTDFLSGTDKKDVTVIYPECLAPNYLSNRTSDDMMYSLLPLYVETFGENNIISHLNEISPKYIAVTNYDTSNYYYTGFGQDYALNVFDYIKTNYHIIHHFGYEFTIDLYEKNLKEQSV